MKLARGMLTLLAGTAMSGVAATALAADLEITPQRLLGAQSEPQNWLLPFGSYDAHNHSSLSQINRNNVANLRVIYLHSLGGTNTASANGQPPTIQSTPVVNEGVMYVHNGWNQVLKLDLRAGTKAEPLWMFDPQLESPSTMRGSVAALNSSLYINTGGSNPRLIKIDANTGEAVWDNGIAPPAEESGNASPSVQPMAVRDKIMVAMRGTRGSINAYDEEGNLDWRFYTIPGPGELGHESWADNWGAWKTGGAVLWTQASYDPETNLVYYGTGEPKPWGDPEFRPGDNLFADSVLALDLDSGKLAWYYQVVPNDTHDRDNVGMRMLYDIEVDGVNRKVLSQFTRVGYFYSWDRTDGTFMFAEPFTFVNWTAGLDPKTGKPVEYDPTVQVQMYGENKSLRAGNPDTGQNVCPNWVGSPTLMPPTYDERRQTAYIGAAVGCYSSSVLEPYEHTDVELGQGREFPGLELITQGHQQGRLVAVDVKTGKVTGEATFPWALYSGTLGTAGDLLFTAQIDGKIMALDKDNLSELWSFNVGTPIAAPPITFAVNGKQYVAFIVGGALYRPDDFNTRELLSLQRNSQLVVFGL